MRITVAPSAAASMSSPTTTCSGESHNAKSGRSRAPMASATIGTSTSVDRITDCVAGIEPRWVAAVSRTDSRSAPRSTAS